MLRKVLIIMAENSPPQKYAEHGNILTLSLPCLPRSLYENEDQNAKFEIIMAFFPLHVCT